MDAITMIRRSINEYTKQINARQIFAARINQLRETMSAADGNYFDAESLDSKRREQKFLQLVAPLVEVAWADGRVTTREFEAILQVADAYGLTEHEPSYVELMRWLTSRPSPGDVAAFWSRFGELYQSLPERTREILIDCLSTQTRYVAEQSSNDLIDFLRGSRVCESETEVLQNIEKRFDELRGEAIETQRTAASATPEAVEIVAQNDSSLVTLAEVEATLDEYGKLAPLVPLVETAWAEGRVTRRERQIVYEAAARFGIAPGTAAFERLNDWLDLHPTAEFYETAAQVLRGRWQRLKRDEEQRAFFNLLSDCTRVAEASGGSSSFASGGARICDEEIFAVKQIAKRLKNNESIALQ